MNGNKVIDVGELYKENTAVAFALFAHNQTFFAALDSRDSMIIYVYKSITCCDRLKHRL